MAEQMSPWDVQDQAEPEKPDVHEAAVAGAKQMVESGEISPEEAHDRLLQYGSVHPESTPDQVFSQMRGGAQNPMAQNIQNKQLQGLDKMQELLKIGAKADSERPESSYVNTKPIANYVDFLNAQGGVKSNNAENTKEPENFENKFQRNFGNNQSIQKDIAALQNSKMMMKDQQDWKTAQMLHARNVEGLKKDTTLQKQIASINSLNNAQSLLTNYAQPQTFQEAQQAVRNVIGGMTGGGKSGVSERQKDYMDSIAKDWMALSQRATNGVSRIPQDDPQLVEMQNHINIVKQDLMEEAKRNSLARSGGYRFIYEDPRFGPELKMSLDDVVNAYSGMADTMNSSMKSGNHLNMMSGSKKSYDSDVLSYAQKHGLSPEAAQAIKNKRSGAK